MAANNTLPDNFILALHQGVHDFSNDTFNVTLHTSAYTFDEATDAVFADATNELPTANGYTAGGVALANTSLTLNAGTVAFDADDPVFNASGGNLVARWAVVRNASAAGGPLVCVILLDDTPADVTVTDGNSLTLQLATNLIQGS